MISAFGRLLWCICVVVGAAVARADEIVVSDVAIQDVPMKRRLADSLSVEPVDANQSPMSVPGTITEDAPFSAATSEPVDAALPFAFTPAATLVVPRLAETTWYTRVEYLNWSRGERSVDSGPLFTLGYQRQFGLDRLRLEGFGSQVHQRFLQPIFAVNGSSIDYLGGRAEYEKLFQSAQEPRLFFFAGIGSRFWVRNQPAMRISTAVPEGPGANVAVTGPPFLNLPNFRQDWLTFYPYVGAETRRSGLRGVELYGRARVGLLGITYELVEESGYTNSWFRNPGVMGQTELGLRSERLLMAGYFEAFAWPRSSGLTSAMLLTVGLKAGFSY